MGADRTRPTTRRESAAMPRNAVLALVACLLAVAAAVVSFVEGNWLGVVWVLLAAVTSNMAWYYIRRRRVDRAAAQG
ncbi:hypothetical protein ACIQGZ_16270 [Streptomyces sp. NPDC092296]|uniref:hypothetical protein n=1 Tax=Streptomyces sp. NPDC092296 TaxID=3366012 RepID=UPI003803141B